VVGLKLFGQMREGTTATDLVLTITELLRRHGVVGKLVEAFGPGVAAVPLENRATIGNMSPEYGATATIFPIDEATIAYLRFTGRTRSIWPWSRPTPRRRASGTTRASSRCSPRSSSSTWPASCPAWPAPHGPRTG